MEANLQVFRQTIASIEAGTHSEITGWVFYDLCTELKQDAEIYVLLHPEGADDYLMKRKLLIYGILTRKTKPGLSQEQTDKLVLVERGLLDLYRMYTELFFELKS